MTEFPIMKGEASMARGADPYFEVPLFSHVIDNLWQGCSPAEFPDETVPGRLYVPTPLYEGVTCHWLWEDAFDVDKAIDDPVNEDSWYIKVPRFDKILNLYQWGKYVVPEGTERVTVLAYDGQEVDYNTFQNAAILVMDWLDEGHRVLVHCQAGLNRSSFVVALVLIERYGMTPDQAIDHIRDSRSPLCLCNDTFRQYLKGLA